MRTMKQMSEEEEKLFKSSLNICQDLAKIWFGKQINQYSRSIDDIYLTIYLLFILSFKWMLLATFGIKNRMKSSQFIININY
jgi:hypothetical protein